MNEIFFISEEIARLKYDVQLIDALAKKTMNEELEIDALRVSNLKAIKSLVYLLTSKFLDYSTLITLDEKESDALGNLLVTHPEFLKGNEETLINSLFVMPAYSERVPFLKVVKKVLMSDVILVFCTQTQNHFVAMHWDAIWNTLIDLDCASKEEYDVFKKKIECMRKRE